MFQKVVLAGLLLLPFTVVQSADDPDAAETPTEQSADTATTPSDKQATPKPDNTPAGGGSEPDCD